jgi:ribosomal protein S18 acetylase RimI-like enzyme
MLQASKTIQATVREASMTSVFAPVDVQLLKSGEEAEVLTFLSHRPIHTVTMASLISDNGLQSPLNRGNFYGCRDINGHLEGVALVGHATLLETVSDRALQALARIARDCAYTHMIMAEQDRVSDFWANYSEAGHEPRLACREWLLELRSKDNTNASAPALRLATEAELEFVMPIQAQLATQESGVDPLVVDPVGFRKRCLRRIQQGRTWVLFEGDSLVFKADVISKSNEVVYVEGIWVREESRNNGTGVSCMAELSRKLLTNAKSICLLVNEVNTRALTFYRKCGFLFRATYETIFLTKKESYPH